jgi:chaperonin GroES
MAELKIQPIGSRIVVKPQEQEETIAGGLIIPPSSNDEKRPATGEVIKLGKGKDKKGNAITFDVKVGDIVYFKKYSPEEVEFEGEKYLILDTEDILAIIK